MKRKRHLLLLLFGTVLMSFSALSLTSCDDDEDENVAPPKQLIGMWEMKKATSANFDIPTEGIYWTFFHSGEITMTGSNKDYKGKYLCTYNNLPHVGINVYNQCAVFDGQFWDEGDLNDCYNTFEIEFNDVTNPTKMQVRWINVNKPLTLHFTKTK